MSYNASAVKIYNATSSLVRFGNKVFSSTLIKRLGYHNVGVVVVNSVVRFATGMFFLLCLRTFNALAMKFATRVQNYAPVVICLICCDKLN
jgi:hypothetical protein